MRYTIYKITNLLNNKFYIGKHQTTNPNDRYFGSGKAILDAIKLHGKQNFIKEILFDFDNEDEMNQKERELITEQLVSNPQCYNMTVGGEGGPHFKGKLHSEETKKKQAIASAKRKLSAESKLKISQNQIGKRAGVKNPQYGKIWINNGISNKIITQSEVDFHLENGYSKGRIQKPMSEETKLKISKSLKQRFNKMDIAE